MVSLLLENTYPGFTMGIPNFNVLDDDPSTVKVTVALNFDI